MFQLFPDHSPGSYPTENTLFNADKKWPAKDHRGLSVVPKLSQKEKTFSQGEGALLLIIRSSITPNS